MVRVTLISFLGFFFVQDSSLRVHSSENVSLNARNEDGDVTDRISVGKSQKDIKLL